MTTSPTGIRVYGDRRPSDWPEALHSPGGSAPAARLDLTVPGGSPAIMELSWRHAIVRRRVATATP
ncbi:hypothetical protein SAMN05660657_03986 [Geodermatophilus amargosae]|uniref:Uncharacterized protein n=1 Tax=Geodermatophilus amargosae TaxID=1296565 RepID=A0A1I7C285_9ACTN|nr:hypothetical protein [Geodermatophilus amargosae]SFT93535.1 hypothetical protein SAMN05660657_03986 [Geodermatophilus amargosae]